MKARRPYTRRVPTRRAEITAQHLSASITDAACRELGSWWSTQEAAYARARTGADISRIAAAVTAICDSCPLTTRRACAELAEVDHYSGLAAGALYLAGRRWDASTPPSAPHATPAPTSDSSAEEGAGPAGVQRAAS